MDNNIHVSMMLNPYTPMWCSNTTIKLEGYTVGLLTVIWQMILILELDVFLAPQDNTLSFFFIHFFATSIYLQCMHIFSFFSLLAWLITKDAAPKSFAQFPTKELFVTSNSNTFAGCFPHSHSLVPPSLVKRLKFPVFPTQLESLFWDTH